MPRPKLVQSQPPVLTDEAKSAGAQGVLALKCVIKKDGALEDCCILKGINTLNIPVFEAVRNWRYEPYVFGGETVNLDYVIMVKIINGDGPTRPVGFPPVPPAPY